jgi:hypothetical protein
MSCVDSGVGGNVAECVRVVGTVVVLSNSILFFRRKLMQKGVIIVLLFKSHSVR